MKFYLTLACILFLRISAQAQISNDYCHSAIEITLTPVGYGQVYSGYYAMATASYVGGNSCNVAPNTDFWYKFVATSSTLKLTNNIANGSSSLLTVYKNACHNLEEIHCQANAMGQAVNLIIGNIYYIKVQSQGATAVFFSFKAEEGINVPNGLCSQAEMVTVDQSECSVSHFFSLVGESGAANPSCHPIGSTYDVWYQMIAPPSGCIEVVEANSNSLYFSTYANDCNALVELDCSVSTNIDPYIRGLVPGETYFVRLYRPAQTGILYDICFKEGPITSPHDECINSITLSIPASCSEVHEENLLLATRSPESGCTGSSNENEDVWFDFVAPATGNVVIQNYSGPSFNIALYEGACGSLTELYCPSTSVSGAFVFNQLIPGTVYTLRIARISSTIDVSFCLYEGEASPVEDECASAIALTVQSGTCNNLQDLEWSFLTPSAEESPCVSADEVDAWFSFTAPASGNIEFSGLSTSITKSIFSGSCGSLVPEVCVKGNYVSGLVPNENYLLLLSQGPNVTTSYFCLLEYTIGSINNTCSNATALAVGSNFIPDWLNAAFETNGDTICEFRPHDLWYTFVAPLSGAVKFSGPSNSFKSFEIYEGSCGSLSPVSCFTFPGTSGHNFIISSLDPGSTYYVKMYDRSHDLLLTHTLSIYEAIPTMNNDCDDAKLISPSNECSGISFANASMSAVALPECAGSASYVDLWYIFDAPSSGVIQFEDSGILGYIAIYENSCGSLHLIFCGAANTTIIDSLTPESTYLLRIISSSRNSTNFCLVRLFPENNSSSCDSPATGILFGTNECGPLVAFDMSVNDPVESDLCGGPYEQWYEFVAPPSGSFNFQLFQGSSNSNIAVYEGDCENLTEIYCLTLGTYESKLIEGLVGGQTYLLRYSTLSPSTDVKFCVSEVNPPTEESSCTEALEIVESSSEECDQIISGSTLGAGESAGAFCGATMRNAVFYTFTPQASASYSVVISNAPALHRITIFENCALQTPITCGLTEIIATFTGGITYIIAVYPDVNNIPSSFDLCVFKPNPALMSGSVGINVPNPQTRLDVNGGIKPGYSEEQIAGNIRWATDLEAYDGTSWKSLIGWDYQATEDINMMGHQINNLNPPLLPTHAATKQYVDAHTDEDSDPLNEIQTIAKSGSTVTLSEGGGTFTDDVDDADNDPNNELQTISKSGTTVTLSNGGGSFTDAVNDADSNPNNEFQTISKSGSTVTLSNGGGSFTDAVNDADSNPNNELQTISKSGSTVTLSNGGGSFTDAVDDADNNPMNEIETWATLAGIPSGFADNVDNVNDADSSPTNEFQTISKSGAIVTLSNSGGSFVDDVKDNDDDPTNEIETWSTLAGIPADFLDGTDDIGAFTHNGTLVVNTGNHNTNDFVFGSSVLPGGSAISATLFFFDKSKGAFRSGNLNNSSVWAPDSIGNYSMAFGQNVRAGNIGTFASGQLTRALGKAATATGYGSQAVGDYTTVMGINSHAYGYAGVALGLNTRSNAFASTSIGGYNVGGGSPISWLQADPIFEIGIGQDEGTRSNALTVLKNGNVGIGIATPEASMHVQRNSTATIPHINLTESVANDGARIMFTNAVETDNQWTLYGLADNVNDNSFFNIFYNGTGNILTARGNGYVGIKGTPGADLHLFHGNNAGVAGFRFENNVSDDWIRFYISSTDADLRLYSKSQGANIIGAFNDVTGAYTALSDARVKMNFEDLHFNWEDFMQLKPLTYQHKAESEASRSIGMVAQAVQPIYPELVKYHEDADLYHLDYAGFGVIAIKAIQEQQKIIDQQNLIIQEQGARLLKVEAMLETLLTEIENPQKLKD